MESHSAITQYHPVFLAPSVHEKLALLPQPMDYCSPVLDLCVRRRPRTPSPEGAHYPQVLKRDHPCPELPSSTILSSPGSDTSETDSTHSQNPSARPKATRPFKAYPKDPLSLAAGAATAEAVLGGDSTEAYAEFRRRMLSQVQQTIGTTNKNMRRSNLSATNPQNADPSYWEKRRKNNEAAKRSRDARRAKEDEIAIRCAFLEQENMKLRYQIAALRDDNERMRRLLRV